MTLPAGTPRHSCRYNIIHQRLDAVLESVKAVYVVIAVIKAAVGGGLAVPHRRLKSFDNVLAAPHNKKSVLVRKDGGTPPPMPCVRRLWLLSDSRVTP